MKRTKWLLLVAGCSGVAALAYWNNWPAAMTAVSPEPVQVTVPVMSAPAAPLEAVVPAPASEPATVRVSTVNTKAPARVTRREPPATVIAERSEPATPLAPEVNHPPAPIKTYEQRVVSAAAEESDRAMAELQIIAAAEPNRPEAYEAMAGVSLKKQDYPQAREQLAAALSHGGKATFWLIHDHSHGNFDSTDTKSACVGELIILADELRFEAGSGDRFATNWTDIREAGSNRFFGSGIGGFHVTFNDGGKYKNVNLAPESKDKAEGRLILELLNANTGRREHTK